MTTRGTSNGNQRGSSEKPKPRKPRVHTKECVLAVCRPCYADAVGMYEYGGGDHHPGCINHDGRTDGRCICDA